MGGSRKGKGYKNLRKKKNGKKGRVRNRGRGEDDERREGEG